MSEAMERPTMKYGEPFDRTVCRIQTHKSLDQRIYRLKDIVRLSRLGDRSPIGRWQGPSGRRNQG